MALLEIDNVHAYYGNIHALKGISVRVDEGEIVTLIGGNGAGKSTTLRTICGLMRPREGKITFRGEDLRRYKANHLVSKGIALVPEGRGVFAKMTVTENLELGAFHRSDKDGIAQDIENAFRLFPRLGERRNQYAGTMSGGEQQMLAIARGLMAKPKLMLLDEPSLGLAPLITKELFRIIAELRHAGQTVLLVEQNARAALKLADYAYVIETGNVVLEGEAKALLADKRVQAAYLGGK